MRWNATSRVPFIKPEPDMLSNLALQDFSMSTLVRSCMDQSHFKEGFRGRGLNRSDENEITT
jgi:hypothetical protein